MKTKIYAVDNPHFLADTFIFSTRYLCNQNTTVYIKINCYGKIEEIGTDIEHRLHGWAFEDIINSKFCSTATKAQRKKLNSIGDEYFCQVRKR